MKSPETKFHEALEALKETGKFQKFTEVSKGCVGVEPKLNIALTLLEEAGVGFDETTQGFTNNNEKATPFKERQYKAYRASGVSEAEARTMAGLPTNHVIKELVASAIHESASEVKAQEKSKEFKERQFNAYRASGLSEAEARVAAGL